MRPIQHLLAFSLLVFMSCASGSAKHDAADSGARYQVVPFVGTSEVHRYTFDNGLRLLVVEDHSSPTFAYNTWFRVGSRDEVPRYTGLAHLFEHMMFKETKTLKEGEFDRILESAGAEGENAFTSRDYTVYVQELPKDKLELITKLEADRMVNLVVNDKAFKTEREVVQNERRFRNENSPDGLMYQEIFGIAFTKHPYHWPVIGYQQDLERMSAKTATDFYHSYYSPNHATIVVVGDVDHENVRALIEKYYGGLPAQASPIHVTSSEPKQTSARSKKLNLNMQVQKLLVGYHIPEVTHGDIPAIFVMQALLTGGKSSRLSRALVDTGIAGSVDSYELEDKDPSLAIITVNLQKGRTAAEAEKVILREIERLQKEKISDKELERAKNRMAFEFYERLDSASELANFLGKYETVANSFVFGVKLKEKAEAITSAEVQAAARAYLDPRNRSVIVGVPK